MTDLTLKKQAQPNAVFVLTDQERDVIKQTVAKNLTTAQYSVFVYTCQALGLNPLLNEITPVIYAGTMSIQVMRDGFLTIAHRSGKFAGLESGIKDDKIGLIGWAKVYHKDYQVPVYQEAEFKEYSTGKNLWLTKPHTMIKKVAESMALRKAFNVNGVYAPEEMEQEIQTAKVLPQEVAKNKETERIRKHITASKTAAQLQLCEEYIEDKELRDLYDAKMVDFMAEEAEKENE